MQDRCGNVIDDSVGYARGKLLSSSTDELRRYLNAQSRIKARLETDGPGSIVIVTGNYRGFPIEVGDLGAPTEEWLGPAQFLDDLRSNALAHLGGSEAHAVAVFNRTSAGIVAATSLLGTSGVISFAPGRGGAHPSVRRGSRLASDRFAACADLSEFSDACEKLAASLVVITPTNSDLDSLEVDDLTAATAIARRAGIPVLVDDAYGARVRPVLQHGPLSLAFGAHIAITNTDKAGLPGPRAGVMAGDHDFVRRVQARAAEWGMEARAPIALAALRSLEQYSVEDLLDEVDAGRDMYEALSVAFGRDRVHLSPLGPVITEDDVWELVSNLSPTAVELVPCEASAAVGMALLDRGILTVNACGQPGARVSIRLKCGAAELEAIGGAAMLADEISRAIAHISASAADLDGIRALLFGAE